MLPSYEKKMFPKDSQCSSKHIDNRIITSEKKTDPKSCVDPRVWKDPLPGTIGMQQKIKYNDCTKCKKNLKNRDIKSVPDNTNTQNPWENQGLVGLDIAEKFERVHL